jgi:hypothetical protein
MADVFAKYGLTVSIGKTKWQRLRNEEDDETEDETDTEEEEEEEEEDEDAEQIRINGQKIQHVKRFTYLGSVFNELGTPTADIKNRINKAKYAMKRLGKVIFNKGTPMGLKRKILMTFVYPTLTYGCETWAIPKTGFAPLNTWWNKQLRRLCGVNKRAHIRTEVILSRTGAAPIEKLIRERRMRYLGHAYRYPQERLTRQAMGAIADPFSAAKNLGWTKIMASEMGKLGIKVKHLGDREKYRRMLNRRFHPHPKKDGDNPTDTESEGGSQGGEINNSN